MAIVYSDQECEPEGALAVFSYADFQRLIFQYPNRDIRHLTLGDDAFSWFKRLEPRIVEIHRHLINYSASTLPICLTSSQAERVALVTIGHLSLTTAMAIARVEAQVLEIEVNALEGVAGQKVNCNFFEKRPVTTKQARRRITNGSLDSRIQSELVRILLDLPSLVIPNPKSELPERDTSLAKRLALSLHFKYATLMRSVIADSKVLTTSPYLSRLEEATLAIRLRQVPWFPDLISEYLSPTLGADIFDHSTEGLSKTPAQDTLELAVQVFDDLVPSIFKADLPEDVAAQIARWWPKSTKTTFTSNAFSDDDLFKYNLAQNIGAVKYVVGQHGNNYGTTSFSDVYPEFESADLFLSWGFEGSKVEAFGVIKPLPKAPKRPFRGALVLPRSQFDSMTSCDVSFDVETYFSKLLDFLDALDARQVKVLVKFHGSTRPDVIARFHSAFSGSRNIKFWNGGLRHWFKLKQLGPVFAYDSTGMLEMAAADGEFFAAVFDGLGMLKPEIRNHYNSTLVSGNLLRSKPQEAAKAVAAWISDGASSQGVAKDFSKPLAIRVEAKVEKLANFLRKPATGN